MIIKHKEFPNKKVYEIDYCGRPPHGGRPHG